MWNDTDIPLAYLITFRSYRTWLPGDKRGSNRYHNRYKAPYREPNQNLQQFSVSRLECPPVILDASKRNAVEQTVREVCNHRNWLLRAINVRTSHVHSVVSIGESSPGKTLNSFKAYATRKMRENKCWKFEHNPWADRGSKRRLWNERSIEIAIYYVINGQGDELPDFD